MKFISIIALLGLLLVGPVLAQENSGKPNSGATSVSTTDQAIHPKGRVEIPITAEREEAVMAFVSQNHAELQELLAYLRDNRRKDYERAIRELARDSERIRQFKDKDGRQYELELKAWTIKSRIQLLTAQMVMGDKDEIRTQLKTLLGDQLDVRLALLKRERERVQERLARSEQEIGRLENERQKILDNQLQVLTKSAADSKKKVKAAKNGSPRPGKRPAKPTVSPPDQ